MADSMSVAHRTVALDSSYSSLRPISNQHSEFEWREGGMDLFFSSMYKLFINKKVRWEILARYGPVPYISAPCTASCKGKEGSGMMFLTNTFFDCPLTPLE